MVSMFVICTFAPSPERSLMGLAVQACILNRGTGEIHRQVMDYLLSIFGGIVMQAIAMERLAYRSPAC